MFVISRQRAGTDEVEFLRILGGGTSGYPKTYFWHPSPHAATPLSSEEDAIALVRDSRQVDGVKLPPGAARECGFDYAIRRASQPAPLSSAA